MLLSKFLGMELHSKRGKNGSSIFTQSVSEKSTSTRNARVDVLFKLRVDSNSIIVNVLID